MAKQHVHADGTREEVRGNVTLYVGNRWTRPKRSRPQGHPPNKHVLADRWTAIRAILSQILHDNPNTCRGADKWKRVNMVMDAMRLQANKGKCYASAQYLASNAFASKKTWDRVLARLRSHSLVSTERLYREDGTQSTNLADFSSLWALLLALLEQRNAIFDHLANGVWIKMQGEWRHFAILLEAPLEVFLVRPPAEAEQLAAAHARGVAGEARPQRNW